MFRRYAVFSTTVLYSIGGTLESRGLILGMTILVISGYGYSREIACILVRKDRLLRLLGS